MAIKAVGYIAITDGEEVHSAGYNRSGVVAEAKHVLGHDDFVVEPASEALVDYVTSTGHTPTIVEVDGVNCLQSEADGT